MTIPDFETIYHTKGSAALAGLPFASMKKAVLGKNYSLSLAFIGEKRSRTLNRTFRGKDKPTDILSFPLSKDTGEIFINLTRSKVESKKFNRKYKNFVAFLFIHGLVHLKGHTHGSRMEAVERKIRQRFGV
jgi:probable rRNA maturation factor